MNDELIRAGRQIIKARFLGWREPPMELPPDSVIDDAVADIVRLPVGEKLSQWIAILAERGEDL